MNKNEQYLFGIRAVGDDKLYSNIEVFPGNMYTVCLTLDLSKIHFKDSISISFEGLDCFFGESEIIGVKVFPDENDAEAITDSVIFRADTQIVFEVFGGELVLDIDGEISKAVFEKPSTLILSRDRLGGKKEVKVTIFLRGVPLKLQIDPEYTMLGVTDDPDEEELDLREGATIMVKIKNKGDRIERDLIVIAFLPSPVLEYKAGTTNIIRNESTPEFIDDTSSDLFNSSGLNIGDIRPGEEISVNFGVKLSDAISSEEDKAYSVWTSVRTKTACFWQSKAYLDKMFMRRTYRFPFY